MKITESLPNQYLSEVRMLQLENLLGFLQYYIHNENPEISHFVTAGSSTDELHLKKTHLLYELGLINSRRKDLIDMLLTINE